MKKSTSMQCFIPYPTALALSKGPLVLCRSLIIAITCTYDRHNSAQQCAGCVSGIPSSLFDWEWGRLIRQGRQRHSAYETARPHGRKPLLRTSAEPSGSTLTNHFIVSAQKKNCHSTNWSGRMRCYVCCLGGGSIRRG